MLKVLGQALNASAIVYVPDDNGQLILQSLRDKRFRVSYLLAPIYAIPIRLGPYVNLSSILSAKVSGPPRLKTLPFDFSKDNNG